MTTPTYGGTGTGLTATGTATVLTPISGGIASLPLGSFLGFVLAQKEDANSNAWICTTAGHGLTRYVDQHSPTGVGSTDTGPVRVAIFGREVTGAELASYAFQNEPAVAPQNGNVSWGFPFLITKGAGSGTWDVVGAGGNDTVGNAAWSALLAAIDLKAEDYCVVGCVTPTDILGGSAFSAETLVAAGLTFGAATEIAELFTGAASDIGGFAFRQAVTLGNDPAATPTVSAAVAGTATNQYGASALVRFRLLPLVPGVPTAVAADPGVYSAALSWAAPATGGSPDGYRVRIDGGASTDLDDAELAHTFTGLSPETDYTLEVQAFNAGGASAWVTVDTTTLTAPDIPYYRVDLTLGDHEWSVISGDAPAYGPLLPLTMGWDIPDQVEFFPAQPSLYTLGFDVMSTDASVYADVVKGSPVTFRMWVDPAADPDVDDPWQSFDGVVTQLDGRVVPSRSVPDGYDFRVTVYAADDTARLIDMPVGFTDDWPLETIADRLQRICDEAGVDRGSSGVSEEAGMVGWLRARDKGAPLSTYEAIRATLRDSADVDSSSTPGVDWYGRYVFTYDHSLTAVLIRVFRRRLFDDGSQQVTLDGGLVRVAGQWTKAPGPVAATWGLVNETVFGTPDAGPPFVRSASLVGLLDGAPDGGSATEITSLGNSLLPDGSTALDGWATRSLTYLAYLNPDPVDWWVSVPKPGNSYLVTPVIVTPIGPELEVNAVDYVAGTLTGARLVIPPGGKYRVEFRLRAELLAGTDLP